MSSKIPLDSKILSGLSEKEKEEFWASFHAGRHAMEMMRKVVLDKYHTSRSEQFAKAAYDKPAWSEFQADKIGEQRTLLYILNNILIGEKIDG